jgi:hypothetical protein
MLAVGRTWRTSGRALASPPPGRRREEFGDVHLECYRKGLDRIQAWIANAAFDARHVGARIPAVVGECFLREAGSNAQLAHARTESLT